MHLLYFILFTAINPSKADCISETLSKAFQQHENKYEIVFSFGDEDDIIMFKGNPDETASMLNGDLDQILSNKKAALKQ